MLETSFVLFLSSLKTKVKVPTVRVLMDLLNEEGRGLHSVPADLLSISIFSKGAKAIYMVYVQGYERKRPGFLSLFEC